VLGKIFSPKSIFYMKENYTKNSLFAIDALFSTIKGFKKVFGASKFIEKSIFVFIIVFLCFSENASAQCTITGTTNASDLISTAPSPGCNSSLTSCGGIIYFGNGSNAMSLMMDTNLDLRCLGPIRFVFRKDAILDFSNGNYNLTLAAGSSIEFEKGSNIVTGKDCSASDLITIGSVKVAACQGGSALTNFPTLVENAGFNTVKVTPASASSCGPSSFEFNAKASPSSGATIKWYDASTGGNLLETGTANSGTDTFTRSLSATTTYYVEAVYSGFTTPRRAVTATVNTTAAPIASAQSFCSVDAKKVNDLIATGVALQWYKTSTGGTALALTTLLETGNYYVSQTLNSCESTRTLVAVTVNSTAAPTASEQKFCDGSTVANLVATGTELKWYTTLTGGAALASTTVLTTGPYYVSQTLNSCESTRTSVVVTVPETKKWNGVAWSPSTDPTIDNAIIFEGNYSLDTNVEGCSCEVKSGNVTIASGKTMTITNGVKVTGGSLTFNNNASLVQTNDDAVNTGSISYIRSNTTFRETDYTYWSSPVKLPKLIDVSPQTRSGFFYSFNASGNNWIYENPYTNFMLPGKGYIFRGPYYTDISVPRFYDAPFVGVPNNGEINIDIAGYSNLIGNPYPSALDADSFLIANRGVLQGTLYFWTHSTAIRAAVGASNEGSGTFVYISDDYASYNLTGGVGTEIIIKTKGNTTASGTENVSNKPTGKIAAGQGFFATGQVAGKATFKNSMRVGVGSITGNNNQFFKTTKSSKNTNTIEKNRVWLNLTNDKGAFKQVLVGYITDATNGYDNAFDGANNNGNQFVNFYSINENKNLTIQARALPFDENDVVPLGYSSVIQGSFSISIDEVDGMLTSENIYLEDKTKNTIHDLKKAAYTFDTEKGTFNERFVLRYKDRTLSSADFELNDSSVIIAKDKNELKIKSQIETISQIVIFDLLGRKVFEKAAINSTDFETSAIKLSNQMFVVKVTLANGKLISKKVMY
jgi:hypothetical protein